MQVAKPDIKAATASRFPPNRLNPPFVLSDPLRPQTR
jgi:hypothetical protein